MKNWRGWRDDDNDDNVIGECEWTRKQERLIRRLGRLGWGVVDERWGKEGTEDEKDEADGENEGDARGRSTRWGSTEHGGVAGTSPFAIISHSFFDKNAYFFWQAEKPSSRGELLNAPNTCSTEP